MMTQAGTTGSRRAAVMHLVRLENGPPTPHSPTSTTSTTRPTNHTNPTLGAMLGFVTTQCMRYFIFGDISLREGAFPVTSLLEGFEVRTSPRVALAQTVTLTPTPTLSLILTTLTLALTLGRVPALVRQFLQWFRVATGPWHGHHIRP